jgi:4-hydroxy-tetrahydrodipicolinate reductase
MNFLACNLGWNLDKVKETIDPVIANEDVSTRYLKIAKGFVAGINHTLGGIQKGDKVIHLNLQMYVGARKPHDLIRIKGNPDLEVHIKKGTPGDIATAAVLVNAIPSVIQAKPGLITMKDLSLLQAINEGHENLRCDHS